MGWRLLLVFRGQGGVGVGEGVVIVALLCVVGVGWFGGLWVSRQGSKFPHSMGDLFFHVFFGHLYFRAMVLWLDMLIPPRSG